jgi:hypothetical protein
MRTFLVFRLRWTLFSDRLPLFKRMCNFEHQVRDRLALARGDPTCRFPLSLAVIPFRSIAILTLCGSSSPQKSSDMKNSPRNLEISLQV